MRRISSPISLRVATVATPATMADFCGFPCVAICPEPLATLVTLRRASVAGMLRVGRGKVGRLAPGLRPGRPVAFPFGVRIGGAMSSTTSCVDSGPAASLLAAAKIGTVPTGFDGAALMRDLERLPLRHMLAEVGEKRGAAVADVDALYAIRTDCQTLIQKLSQVTTDPLRRPAHHALLEISTPSIHQLLADLRALIAGLPVQIQRLAKLSEEGPLLPGGGASAREELFGKHLPALYSVHFGKGCGISLNSGPGDSPTEGVRFLCAAYEAMGLGTVMPEAAVKAHRRWKRTIRGDNAA